MRRHMATVTLMTALVAAGVAGTAAPALAATGQSNAVVATGGGSLNVRATPGTALRRVGTLADGARIRVVCQQPGQRIAGAVRTTALWDKLPDGRYVTDAYVRRSGTGLPRCGEQAEPAPSGAWVAPANGRLVSGFHTKDRPTHDGVDLGAARNTPVRAAAAGKVSLVSCNVSAGHSCDVDGGLSVKGCGWYVEIVHDDGLLTRYCHLIRRPVVTVGQPVKPSQIIGYVGSSGNSSGPHLHFEVRQLRAQGYQPVDPVPFMAARGVHLA